MNRPSSLDFEGGSPYNIHALSNEFIILAECPACGSGRIAAFKKGNISAGPLTEEQIKITDKGYGKFWDLSRCQDCRHVFANPCPKPEFIAGLYGRVKDPLYQEEAEGRAQNFVRILSYIERLLPKKGRLFDVGAATGILLDQARRRGWEVDGVEPSLWSVRTAFERYGLTVRKGTLEAAPLGATAYDTVTMIDIIEHTPTPFEALSKARAALKPDGILCLVTPDMRSIAARLAGRRWWHYRPGHLAYFSRSSLNAILRRAGFAVLKARKYAWTFSAHYLASRKPAFSLFIKSPRLASFLKRIPLKLALGDSLEIYARKDQ